jgi:hypothetical protein
MEKNSLSGIDNGRYWLMRVECGLDLVLERNVQSLGGFLTKIFGISQIRDQG